MMSLNVPARCSLLLAALAGAALAQDRGPEGIPDAPQPNRADTRTTAPIDEVPEGLGAADWAGIRAAYEASRHAAYSVADGYRAANPGQGWRTDFDGRGFSTRPDAGGWTWGLQLERYGFAGRMRSVAGRADAGAEGGRVTYDWDDTLEEWYVNDARGLEHGYTVRRRPPGDGGPLTFQLAVRGTLQPEVYGNGRGVSFVNDGGTTVLTYSGLTVLDAAGRELDACFERVAGGLFLSVDEHGARYPLTIDPLAQRAYLKASNTDALDQFGLSVAVSGDTVVVGAPQEASSATGVDGDQSDDSAFASGAAYVFVRSGTSWSQEAYLKASNTDAGDEFGWSVAVSGDTVVVGAWQEASSATGVDGDQSDDSASLAGAAYVFVRSGTSWSQESYLKASNTGVLDQFAFSLAASGGGRGAWRGQQLHRRGRRPER